MMTIGAMILAAGRGERMRPLSGTLPKPLLAAGGKPLIVWQIEALVRAGITRIAINASHLADRLIGEIGDGRAFGVSIGWSREDEPLETAGGIATAMPLLPEGPALIVSGDIWTAYDYARLAPVAARMARDPVSARVHLVMVPNPSYHPQGDFRLVAQADGPSRIVAEGGPTSTYGNIGVYDTALFRALPRGVKFKLLPLLLDWIAQGQVSGESYDGPWENVGTPADLDRLNIRLLASSKESSMTVSDNPLFEFTGLTRFDRIKPEHVSPAVDTLIGEARATVERVAQSSEAARWDTVAEPIAFALDRLDRAWSTVRHLNAVVSTTALRDAYNGNLPKVTGLYADIGQDERLYAKYKAIAAAPEFAQLASAQQRVVQNELRDFRLGGAELPAAEKQRFKAIQEELAKLSAAFDDNVLDATNGWAHYVGTPAALAGMPEDAVAQARAEAEAEGRAGYKLTLRAPSYVPVVEYADDRSLRATLHRGYATLASDLGGDPAHDNTGIIARILALRQEEATLLGYANFAEVSLVPKMASTPADVLTFVRDLARRARPFAEADYAELVEFARTGLGIAEPQAWDLPYASEKLRQRRYSFSEQEVKQYFREDRVLAGLFNLVATIYGVAITEAPALTWHPDVRFFDIRDRDSALIGQFYLDLYAREGKQSGAWMDDLVNRRRDNGGRAQHPVAFLTCNFAPPTVVDGKKRPALLTHREVVTIFHEFGHGLHLLLTRVDVPGVSGIEGVEWDAVELPSQIMENWAWEWEVLQQMTAHVDTGEKLPRAIYERMRAAKNFQSGLATLRQVEFALFDMLLHTEYVPGQTGPHADPRSVLAAVRREVAVVPRPEYDRFMHAFGHIFAGGYAAGYYSYKWAEVLSADAFSLFEEVGVMSPAAGARFRDEVLSRGGSRPALASFVAFRGRAPELDALLRHNGMTTSS